MRKHLVSTPKVGWANCVADNYELIPLGRLVRLRNEKNDPIRETQVLSLTADRGVIHYEEKGAVGNQASEDISRYSIVKPGDIVVNSMNVIIGSVGLSKYNGVLSPVYYVLTAINPERIDMRYLAYHFQIESFQRGLIRIGYGILDHRMRIPWINLAAELIVVPPIDEQRRIADFLDEQIGFINRALDLRMKELEIRTEYERKVIDDLLSPFPKIKLKYVCEDSGQYGLNITPDEYRSDGVRLLRTSDFGSRDVEPIYVNGPLEERYLVREGDLLLTRSGATIGQSFLVGRKDSGSSFAGFLIRYRCKSSYSPKFLATVCRSTSFQEQVAIDATVSTIPNFNADKYANIDIPDLTPLEQERILVAINNSTEKQSSFKEPLNRSIKLLTELRDSMIMSAITGQLTPFRNGKQ